MALAQREATHDYLVAVSGLDEDHIYFQPPEDRLLEYPCIVYERDNSSVQHADNIVYRWKLRYQVTLIDQNPDSDVVDKLLALPLCTFSRHFATSGLNHDVFTLYH
jgi:hypothetical protein